MEAKLKKSYKYPRAVLFSGREYVKTEFRPVPKEFEDLARKDDRVEIQETKAEVKAAATEVAPEKPKRQYTRRSAKDDNEESEG